MNRSPSATQVAVALAAVYLIWGSTYLGIRFAIETLPPLLMTGVRYLIAGLVLYLLQRLRGTEQPTWEQWRAAAIVGVLLFVGGNGAVVIAETCVPSGIVSVVVASVPLSLVLLEWRLQGVRPSGLAWIGLALGFSGIAMLVVPGQGHHIATWGILVVLAGTVSWAAGSYYARRAPLPRNTLLGAGMEMMSGGVAMLLLSGLWGEHVSVAAVSFRSVAALFYLICVGSLLGFSAYTWLLRNVRLSLVGTYAYVNPVVAVFLGWAIAGDPITGRILLASATVLAAVALIMKK
ncbi:MAG: EamA family transporter [Candidatus Xenobia bacterium]